MSSSADASIEQRERRRSAIPVTIGVIALWLVPLSFVAVVAANERGTRAGQIWHLGWWGLYGLSLLAWKLPPAWFRPRAWELSGRVYEALGVRWYKQYMVGGDFENRRIRRQGAVCRTFADSASLRRAVNDALVAERAHIIMLLFGVWPALFGAATGWWRYAAVVTMGNVLVNVYPIMLQRDTRARVARIGRRRAG